jgi:DNA-binding CsgD family transcriptional regulator
MLLLARRAREELNAVGARPRRSALSGPGALTPAEHRVAQLAALGHGNRAIAERLYVTQRTVETHLTHAFAKLDIRSRAELASALEPQPAALRLSPLSRGVGGRAPGRSGAPRSVLDIWFVFLRI